jgi:ketosteroid isomerase-like protein
VLDLSNQGGVGLLRSVTSLPRIPAGLATDRHLELVMEEAALLDFVKSFAHIVNSADVAAVVSNYADDCTWTSPRGRFVGSGEIRSNYELYFNPVRWFSFWTNVTVRFVRPFDEAYTSAYQYSIGVGGVDAEPRGAVSTDVWHVKRTGESWKIAERRIDILDSHSHRVLPPAPA